VIYISINDDMIETIVISELYEAEKNLNHLILHMKDGQQLKKK